MFKFESITHRELFMLLVNAIDGNNFFIYNRKYSQVTTDDLGKIKMLIRIGDLDLIVYLYNLYVDTDDSIKMDSNYVNSRITINVCKVDLEFGHKLLKHHYYFRRVKDGGEITDAYDLLNFLIPLINKRKPFSSLPKRNYPKDKVNQKKWLNMEIRKHARVLKIDELI